MKKIITSGLVISMLLGSSVSALAVDIRGAHPVAALAGKVIKQEVKKAVAKVKESPKLQKAKEVIKKDASKVKAAVTKAKTSSTVQKAKATIKKDAVKAKAVIKKGASQAKAKLTKDIKTIKTSATKLKQDAKDIKTEIKNIQDKRVVK